MLALLTLVYPWSLVFILHLYDFVLSLLPLFSPLHFPLLLTLPVLYFHIMFMSLLFLPFSMSLFGCFSQLSPFSLFQVSRLPILTFRIILYHASLFPLSSFLNHLCVLLFPFTCMLVTFFSSHYCTPMLSLQVYPPIAITSFSYTALGLSHSMLMFHWSCIRFISFIHH